MPGPSVPHVRAVLPVLTMRMVLPGSMDHMQNLKHLRLYGVPSASCLGVRCTLPSTHAAHGATRTIGRVPRCSPLVLQYLHALRIRHAKSSTDAPYAASRPFDH